MTIIIPECKHDWVAHSILDIADRAGVEILAKCVRVGCDQVIVIEMPYGLLMRRQHARQDETAIPR